MSKYYCIPQESTKSVYSVVDYVYRRSGGFNHRIPQESPKAKNIGVWK